MLSSGKNKKTKQSTSAKKKTDDKPLAITGGKPLSEAFLNNFFKVFSADQIYAFDELFKELQPKLKALNITGEEFMKQIRDAYSRFQEHKDLDPFYPMDKKGQKYVEKFMRESIESVYQSVVVKKNDFKNS